MTYYIRPRQDISLSRAAQMMRTLVLLDYEPTMHVYKAPDKPEMLIRLNAASQDDYTIHEKAIAQLVDLDKFNFSNFKIVDLGPYEERVEVD